MRSAALGNSLWFLWWSPEGFGGLDGPRNALLYVHLQEQCCSILVPQVTSLWTMILPDCNYWGVNFWNLQGKIRTWGNIEILWIVLVNTYFLCFNKWQNKSSDDWLAKTWKETHRAWENESVWWRLLETWVFGSWNSPDLPAIDQMAARETYLDLEKELSSRISNTSFQILPGNT